MICGMDKMSTLEETQVVLKKLREDFECKHVIITLGSEGALFWDHQLQDVKQYSAPKVQAVDTTGAGDCFVGALAYLVSKGQDLTTAIPQSILNASSSVLKKGTQSSFPHSLVASL